MLESSSSYLGEGVLLQDLQHGHEHGAGRGEARAGARAARKNAVDSDEHKINSSSATKVRWHDYSIGARLVRPANQTMWRAYTSEVGKSVIEMHWILGWLSQQWCLGAIARHEARHPPEEQFEQFAPLCVPTCSSSGRCRGVPSTRRRACTRRAGAPAATLPGWRRAATSSRCCSRPWRTATAAAPRPRPASSPAATTARRAATAPSSCWCG